MVVRQAAGSRRRAALAHRTSRLPGAAGHESGKLDEEGRGALRAESERYLAASRACVREGRHELREPTPEESLAAAHLRPRAARRVTRASARGASPRPEELELPP